MTEIDYTAWEYGGDVTCPECEDNGLFFGVDPVWATDQCELYEVMCPICGVIDLDGDIMDNEAMDQMHHDIASYLQERYGDLPPYTEDSAHTGFYMQTDTGIQAHVLGNPNMSDETAKALAAMIDCAAKYINSDKSPTLPDQDLTRR